MSDLLSRLQEALRGTYAVERELGRGGMATVFLGRDLKHDRAVAVKVLHPELAAAVGADRFRREIQIETRLAHPNILPIYDSGEADGLLFYVMPFIAGESLRARMAREHQLPIDDAVRITCEVADALDYAHRHGLIHRDIKPENILLEDGHAIVADFGIARAVSAGTDQQKLTESGVTLGTPLYMSPEQAMGERDLDGRSDQYSLACVLYEMLAGDPPFRGQSAHALIARHVLDPVPSLLTVRDTVPDEVETAITCALAKVPADRFATVAAFSAALRGTGTFPVTRRSTLGRTGARRVVRSRRPSVIAGGVAILLVGAAAAAWALWQRPAANAAASELDPRRIAVLYFDDQSRDGALAYLADGLSESLIEQLDAVGALDVISKNGVAPLKGKPVNVDSVARQLRAGTVVRGSVEDEGDRVRLTVRLIDANSGADFRRASFSQLKANVLTARDSLASQVAFFLRQRLGDEVRLREARAGTRNADAWSLVQQAEKTRKDADALAAADSAAASARKLALADSLLARAEALDAKWATPIVQRAWLASREQRSAHDPLRKREIIDRGIGHAERALTVDPRNADAFEARGALRYIKHVSGLATDPTEAADLLRLAEADLRQSTNLNPGQATAWNTLSFLLYRKYNRVEANLAAQRAYAADAYLTGAPDILHRLYATSWDMEQFVEAAKWCDLGHRRFPENHVFLTCQLWLLSTNVRRPDPDKAWQLLDELDQLTPASRREMVRRAWQMVVALSIARAGHPDSARRVIERSRANSDIDPRGELTGQEIVVRAMLGDKDEALRLLKFYLTSHPEHREGFTKANRWEFRALQTDPQYLALVGAH